MTAMQQKCVPMVDLWSTFIPLTSGSGSGYLQKKKDECPPNDLIGHTAVLKRTVM